MDAGSFDMLSTRARRLTEELIKIGANVPVFDCPDVTEEENTLLVDALFKTAKHRKKEKQERAKEKRKTANHALGLQNLIEKLKRLGGVAEVADHNLEDLDSEIALANGCPQDRE